MASGKNAPTSVDGYLSQLDPERRAALEKLRGQILRLVPSAEPCISYSMPAFRVGGKVVAGFLATNAGCSYYPHSGRTLQTLAPQLAAYSKTSGALHFETRRGLPLALVRQLIQVRLAEIEGANPASAQKPERAGSAKASRAKAANASSSKKKALDSKAAKASSAKAKAKPLDRVAPKVRAKPKARGKAPS